MGRTRSFPTSRKTRAPVPSTQPSKGAVGGAFRGTAHHFATLPNTASPPPTPPGQVRRTVRAWTRKSPEARFARNSRRGGGTCFWTPWDRNPGGSATPEDRDPEGSGSQTRGCPSMSPPLMANEDHCAIEPRALSWREVRQILPRILRVVREGVQLEGARDRKTVRSFF